MKELTPKQIVEELDKYIIGQKEAKKAVAIALRNRYRRSLLPEGFKDEVKPKNILMIGPTGVGKTEIARRLSKLVDLPFIKVEATKFTEVGYVGRDVDSMVRDLVEESIRMVKTKKIEEVYEKSKKLADDKLIELLMPFPSKKKGINPLEMIFGTVEEKNNEDDTIDSEREIIINRRKELKEKLIKGELDDKTIEIDVEDSYNSTVELFSGLGMEEYNINMGDIFGDLLPKKTKKKRVTIREARKIINNQEAQKLIDMDEVMDLAIKKAEQNGMIFIDEIDKIAGKDYGGGPDVSREGVQRDILPIIEGTTVVTKYGPVKTDHILFIAAGAFHVSKVGDLIPEIQGRFPIRVELENLTEENFKEILTKPKNAITKQYEYLIKTEGINLEFTEEAIGAIAKMAFVSNEQSENIGARRLQTVMEKLLEDISFEAPDLDTYEIIIDEAYVNKKLMAYIHEKDISKYIL
ncbi:ATP-dependent protease ATPase subunit HslU [Clostridium sp. Cult2]|uniref:ATP-dependent protease ATPase subunit HslU n=1 Tax=Clostridium sp. Cult2 TaxID=2079003 RepID=UPI001F025CB2|nr:ATP-dependent protease ATPase subunit HslU [Clostridium sp. Cult2]MCF6466322.1 HslU--HslV peptidase ATPase subunit [Clostridium sp. Cult2]